ncbi:hypothetical protein GP475_07385 [Corynebacterium poyangense]|uniref:Trypsin n=1 Tax=Corynebacterium poyangense TaxID=2684405 RepID=A0A7H0SPK2_9CORY|nr:hypothetical protein [Corynebacterium poyangense]QNQ90477.1 hypothetical protein GP475_07385 [Corynebacterium poyangense]
MSRRLGTFFLVLLILSGVWGLRNYASSWFEEFSPDSPHLRASSLPSVPTTTFPTQVLQDAENSGIQVVVPRDPLWAPGTTFGIIPPVPNPDTFTLCTSAFSFRAPDVDNSAVSRNYAVTAGHCGQVGDKIYALDKDGQPDLHQPLGTFRYSSLMPQNDGSFEDWGLIEITNPQTPVAPPQPAIPTVLAAEPLPCKYGGTTLETCGFINDDQIDLFTLDLGNGHEADIKSLIPHICQRPGDSGGPHYISVGNYKVIYGIASSVHLDGSPDTRCRDSAEEEAGVAPMWGVLDAIRHSYPDAYLDFHRIQ